MNAAPSSIKIPSAPPLIVFEPQTRDIVLGSIKLVHKRLKIKGVVDAKLEYQDLLRDPAAMFAFIHAFKANRDIACELTVDAAGKAQEDDNAKLICSVTLAQIERLLVITCAKKVAANQPPAPAAGKPAKGQPATPANELSDIKKDGIAFAWQLPMLPLYIEMMKDEHFRVLGPRIFLLRTPEALESVARLDPADIRKAERLMAAEYEMALATYPRAIRGGSLCDAKSYKLLKATAGKHMWQLLSGDPQIIVEFLALSGDRVTALAAFAAKMSPEAFRQIEGVPTPLLKPMFDGFAGTFGDVAQDLIGNEEFAKKFLFTMVGVARSMPSNSEKDIAAAPQMMKYKWESLHEPVTQWWEARAAS